MAGLQEAQHFSSGQSERPRKAGKEELVRQGKQERTPEVSRGKDWQVDEMSWAVRVEGRQRMLYLGTARSVVRLRMGSFSEVLGQRRLWRLRCDWRGGSGDNSCSWAANGREEVVARR